LNEIEVRSINLRPETFEKMLEFLEHNFGSAGDSMIFQMGRVGGVFETHRALKEIDMSKYHSKRELMEIALNHMSHLGIGDLALSEFNVEQGVVKITICNSPFKPLCTRIDLAQCFWNRGFLAGVVLEVTGMHLTFRKSECYAQGDAVCSILLTLEELPRYSPTINLE
jgi:predicted hydrocarbon binding protein